MLGRPRLRQFAAKGVRALDGVYRMTGFLSGPRPVRPSDLCASRSRRRTRQHSDREAIIPHGPLTINPGTHLGPYEIQSALGAGGMGEVYRARDTRLNRVVAIKVLPHGVSDDPRRRERFDHEARTISSLNHPHICTLFDVGHQDGVDYLVMELLEGQTLSERLARGALPLEQALQYADSNRERARRRAPEGHRPPRPQARRT